MAKAKKEKKPPEPFWNDQVGIFFEFTKYNFHETPSFDGSAPRDLKDILTALRKRAEDKNIEWSYEVATTRFRLFLEWAHKNDWLKKHWLLFNINRQKDVVFFDMAKNIRR